jgi:ribosomal protein S18 acetylase RimI-like enzyme
MTSSTPFSIRLATLDDAQSIANFNINMASETENIHLKPEVILAGAQRLITDTALGYYLVAETDNQIIGSLMVTTEWSDWRNGQFWWIQSVYIIPEWRRKGLYRSLYEKVKSLAESNDNICGFRLYVEKENTVAQSAYEKVGMLETHYKMYEELKPGIRFTEE